MQDARKGWYLVYVKPRHESIAETHLVRQGFHIYLPVVQQHKRQRQAYHVVTEPLFPRYLFIQLDSEIEDWSKIRSTRGCVSLVRFGMLPARVPDRLVEQLKQDTSTRLITASSVPDFKEGDRVRVLDGVLMDYEGIVQTKESQQRVTLLLKIAEGHTRSVKVPVDQLTRID